MILFFDSVYVIGGTMSVIASLMYLGLSSGFTETMMNDRMGKYLVTLQVSLATSMCCRLISLHTHPPLCLSPFRATHNCPALPSPTPCERCHSLIEPVCVCVCVCVGVGVVGVVVVVCIVGFSACSARAAVPLRCRLSTSLTLYLYQDIPMKVRLPFPPKTPTV
jgi:hypothetical protein